MTSVISLLAPLLLVQDLTLQGCGERGEGDMDVDATIIADGRSAEAGYSDKKASSAVPYKEV